MARVNRSTGFFLVIGVVVLLATVSGVRMLNPGGESTTEPEGPPPEPSVYCSGNVDVPSGLTILVPNAPGRVKELKVQEGDSVKSGQILVRLDDELVRQNLAVAEQGLKVAKAKLDAAREAVQRAKLEHATKVTQQKALVSAADGQHQNAEIVLKQLRDKNNGDTKITPEYQIQQAQLAVTKAKQQLELAQTALKQLESIDPNQSLKEPEEALKEADLKVRAAEKDLERFVIRAPSDGTILELNYQVGGPCPLPLGDANASRAMIFRPTEDIIVRAEVDQEWAMLVKTEQKATLTFRGANFDYKYTGTVIKVSDYIQRRRSRVVEIDQFTNSQVRECIIKIDAGSKHPIIHGMRMGVQIHTGQ